MDPLKMDADTRNATARSKAEAQKALAAEEGRRTEARANRQKAFAMLERLKTERAMARHCSRLGGLGAACSGLTLVILLLAWGDLVRVAPTLAAVPAALAALLQIAARLLQDPTRLDVADAVVCEQIVTTLNWAAERGVDASPAGQPLARIHARALDGVDARSERRGEAMRVAAERELARVLSDHADLGPKARTEMARRCERIVPTSPSTTLRLEGTLWPVRMIDVSRSGVAIAAKPGLNVPVGKRVDIGSRLAICVRNFAGGFALEFLDMIEEEDFNVDVRL